MGGGDSLAAFRLQSRRALIWLIVGGATVFAANLLFGLASLLIVLVVAILWIALAGNAVGDAWTSWSRLAAVGVSVTPIAVAGFCMALATPSLFYWSHVAPSWWLLRTQRAAFERAFAGGPVPTGVGVVERKSGRAAFHTVNGMLAAWRAIVYDPSGRLAKARGWGGGAVPDDVRYLFGSETRWCQRLDGAWFHCHFD